LEEEEEAEGSISTSAILRTSEDEIRGGVVVERERGDAS
jgi:hypothetical protein